MSQAVRYRVFHETCYSYSSTVLAGQQLAHLAPRPTAWQTVHSHRVEVEPGAQEQNAGLDYFGNGILRFTLETPHDELIVRALSEVSVAPHCPLPGSPSPAWEAAVAPPYSGAPDGDLDVAHFRAASPQAPLLGGCADYARISFRPRRPWLEAALELTRRIRQEFAYDAEATTVGTQVAEVLEHRRGVCQDFAHLMISCLRSLGLPARYVSGYVLNQPAPGQAALTGADASHAWVETWCPGLGWVAFDPTNGKLADTEFVTLGWGREFSDVTPLRGVVLGAASQTLAVAVKVEPLAA